MKFTAGAMRSRPEILSANCFWLANHRAIHPPIELATRRFSSLPRVSRTMAALSIQSDNSTVSVLPSESPREVGS